MASIYQLKPLFQNMLRPCMHLMRRIGMTPNQVTLLALACSIALAVCMIIYAESSVPWLCLPAWLFVRMALNAIDGIMARECNLQSPLGAVLNEVGDVIADTALFLPFMMIAGVNMWAVLLFAFAAMLTEMTGIIGVQIGASRRYDGPMGKSDRAFVVGALALAYGLGWRNAELMSVLFWVMFGLACLCVLNRVRCALAELKETESHNV